MEIAFWLLIVSNTITLISLFNRGKIIKSYEWIINSDRDLHIKFMEQYLKLIGK